MFDDLERDKDTSLGKKRCCDWLVFFVPCPATNQVFLAFDMQYVPYISWLFLAVYSIFVIDEWSSQTHCHYPWFAHDNMVVKNESIFLC